MNHLFDALSSNASPDAAFLRMPDGSVMLYRELWELTSRAAHFLRQHGVEPGSRVSVQAEKSPLVLVLYLATVRAGGIFIPLNTAYTKAEVDYFLGDTRPTFFVCDPSRLDELTPVAAANGVRQVGTLAADGTGSVAESLASMPDEPFDLVARGEDDIAAILYTSGTTGRSKGAMLSHGNLLSNAMTLREGWRFTQADILLHALPVYHAHGLFVAGNVLLLAGGSMLFMPRFDAEIALDLMAQATSMMGVPTFYTRLLQNPRLDRETTAGMRVFISGSAPLLAETHDAWRERTGHMILERYGMTETTMITSNPYDGERIPGSVGPALEGVRVRIVDRKSGDSLPDGEIGIVEVTGPNVFKGYWNKPEQTAEAFREDGYFVTGDLGYLDPNGYLCLVGRDKDLIISGGLNVYPSEVESEINEIGGVLESAVIGLPHPDFGEAVTAVVVREPDAAHLEAEHILQPLQDRLARFKQPKKVFFVDELPRNALGKVQKNLLRDRYASEFGERS